MLYSTQEDETDDSVSEDAPALGFASALAWLIGMTVVIAILSEYVVGTIEVHQTNLLSDHDGQCFVRKYCLNFKLY